MSTLPKSFLTPEQYLEIERQAEFRSEYYDGQMFPMVGARQPHGLIKTNLVIQLGVQLRPRQCQLYSGDMRVLVAPTGLYTYPDGVVVCEGPQFKDDHRDILLNPAFIAEVLSPSTGDYDHGRKFEHYRSIGSLRAYLMISSERIGAELFTPQSGWWKLMEFKRLEDTIELECIGCTLNLADLYEKVDFG